VPPAGRSSLPGRAGWPDRATPTPGCDRLPA